MSSFVQSLPNSWMAQTRKTSSLFSKLRAFYSTDTSKVICMELSYCSCKPYTNTALPLVTFFYLLSELEPYKYAGYPMLIKTITMETEDNQLFSKTSPLLPAAVELAFHTVNCSALNAEELRRDNGIEVQRI